MTAKTISASLAFLVAVACSSPEKDAYRRLASKANPLFTAMKPVAAKMLALRPDDRAAIVEVCMAADESLHRLREIDFHAEHVAPDEVRWSVSTYAKDLLDSRSLMCKQLDRGPAGLEQCSQWCLETWTRMIEAVDRLRQAAKDQGVEIVSLRP